MASGRRRGGPGRKKAKAGWAPGPSRLCGGSGEPLTAMSPWSPLSARFPRFLAGYNPRARSALSEAGSVRPAPSALPPRTDEGRGSVKSSREGFDGVKQILPSNLHAFLHLRELCLFGILKVHDAVLELREAGTQEFEFPIVLELDVHFLPGKTSLQNGDARGQLLDFPNHTVQIGFLQLHDRSTSE